MEEELTALRAENEELRAQLEYYSTRGQRMLDLLAQRCLEMLEGDAPLTSGQLSMIRQLLRDQGIVDLKSGDTPVNHLSRVLPFKAPEDGDDFAAVKQPAE